MPMRSYLCFKNIAFFFFCLALVFTVSEIRAQATEGIKSILNATVQIESFDKSGSKLSSGSGFIIDSKGIIVTNNHVLSGANAVLVKTSNGDVYKEVIVRDFDEVKDLALIKINGFDLPEAMLGNSNKTEVGTKIFVCGNTLGEFANTTSEGVISGIRHNESGFKFIQMTAPISPGNSGGPIANEKGEVVGVAVASRVDGQNVNFAIPINYVLGMVENNKNLSIEKYAERVGVGVDSQGN